MSTPTTTSRGIITPMSVKRKIRDALAGPSTGNVETVVFVRRTIRPDLHVMCLLDTSASEGSDR